jgi:hypothetical protein
MTTEEMAVYIGERLFSTITTKVYGSTNDFVLLKFRGYNITKRRDEYINWLLSPNGINEAKLAMIERGWDVHITYYSNVRHTPWAACFWRRGSNPTIDFHEYEKSEAEAVIYTAYKALKAEEDKAKLNVTNSQ